MSEKVDAIYLGPADSDEAGDYFRVRSGGTRYTLYVGVPTAIPKDLAEELGDHEGHDFEFLGRSEGEGYESQTVPQLRELAEGREIDLTGATNKPDIIERLVAADAQAQEAAA